MTRYVWGKYTITATNGKGNFVEHSTSPKRNYRPDNGIDGNYWYVYIGSDNIDPVSVSISAVNVGSEHDVTITITPSNNLLAGGVSYVYDDLQDGSSNWVNRGTGYGTSIKVRLGYQTWRYQVRARATSYDMSSQNYVYSNTLDMSKYAITATSDPSNGGTVSGAGSYENGHSATVTATPASGYVFVRWEENGESVSTNASYTFTVSRKRDLVAVFGHSVSLSVSPSSSYGSVSGAGNYKAGASVTVKATSASGYRFSKWTEGGTTVSTSSSCTFSITKNRALTAVFSKILPSYRITVTASPENGGTVTGGGTYESGKTVTLRATPASDFKFVGWQEGEEIVSTNAVYSFSVSKVRTLTAIFKKKLSIYVSVEEKARKGGDLYIGVDGKARKAVAAYIGDSDGKARRFL